MLGGDWTDGTMTDFKRSEEHTSELQSLMRNSYAVFCLKNKDALGKRGFESGYAVGVEPGKMVQRFNPKRDCSSHYLEWVGYRYVRASVAITASSRSKSTRHT